MIKYVLEQAQKNTFYQGCAFCNEYKNARNIPIKPSGVTIQTTGSSSVQLSFGYEHFKTVASGATTNPHVCQTFVNLTL